MENGEKNPGGMEGKNAGGDSNKRRDKEEVTGG